MAKTTNTRAKNQTKNLKEPIEVVVNGTVNEDCLRESCGKCQSKEFSIAKDAGQKRYCSKCNNVWAPMTTEQLEVKAVLADNLRLKNENKNLREELETVKAVAQPIVNAATNKDMFN